MCGRLEDLFTRGTANNIIDLEIYFLRPVNNQYIAGLTFVMTTISSRGKLSLLIAFPSTTSESPLEYI